MHIWYYTNDGTSTQYLICRKLTDTLAVGEVCDGLSKQQACLGFSGQTVEVGEGHRGYRDHRACLSPSVAEAGNYSWERRPQLDAICQRDGRARLKRAQRPSEVPLAAADRRTNTCQRDAGSQLLGWGTRRRKARSGQKWWKQWVTCRKTRLAGCFSFIT